MTNNFTQLEYYAQRAINFIKKEMLDTKYERIECADLLMSMWQQTKSQVDKNLMSPFEYTFRHFVSLDPGETTGWTITLFPSYFEHESENTKPIVICCQSPTKTHRQAHDFLNKLGSLLYELTPKEIEEEQEWNHKFEALNYYNNWMFIIEDYRVYSWKSDDHKWASLFTPQWIGMIKEWCLTWGIRWHTQMAVSGKAWCTDDMLIKFQMYSRGLKHGRDSLRHMITTTLFCKEIKST